MSTQRALAISRGVRSACAATSQDLRNAQPICRPGHDMMEANNPVGIDEYISTQLSGISREPAQSPALEQESQED